MNAAKIHLSANELALVQDADILLTKNGIIKKVYHLFGSLANDHRHLLGQASGLPKQALEAAPKIARGENYEGLPYVMLDYPRIFSRADILAIRTFFWWGHFFSVTLHVKGEYKRIFEANLKKNLPLLASQGFYISTGDDEWKHNLEEDHYSPLEQLDASLAEEILSAKEFCKLSARVSLQRWNEAKERLLHLFHVLLWSMDLNSPNDGTGLSPGNPITGSGP